MLHFFDPYCIFICVMLCSVLSMHVQLMMFMITLPEMKPQNTKTAVIPELI